MEGIFALFFTFILVLPLVIQLQMLIANPKKFCTIFHYYAPTLPENSKKTSSLNILQHFTKEPTIFNASSSDSKISLTNLRTVSSTPVIPKQTLSLCKQIPNTEAENATDKQLEVARHSSTFIKTDQVLPIVDITWNYSSYRYKTFESCLRDRYGNRYPPGEVVLNSMQLNLLDSHTNVSLNVAGLFDFLKEESDPRLSAVPRKLEIEYLNPLDHFVAKQLERPDTVERFTETDEEDRWCDTTDFNQQDSIVPVITGREKNQPNRRSSRKIEPLCKCYLSSSRRVYGTNDSRSWRDLSFGEHDRLQTAPVYPGID